VFSIRNLKIRDQILLVTLPPLFVLLCAVALFFYAYWSTINTQRAAVRSKEMAIRDEVFLRHCNEANMSVRGYLLTRQKEVLAPYDQAVLNGLADLIALRELDASDARKEQQVLRIRADFESMQKQWALPAI